jgi:hypothetical protein
MKKFAYVTSKGEAQHVVEPSDDSALKDQQTVDGYLVVEVPYETDTTELLETKVYNSTDKSWSSRELKPSVSHYWDGEWKLDLDAMQQEIRAKRAFLLSKTDWTQLPDASISEELKQSYKVYRQQLRDITDQLSKVQSINEVQWPEPPARS